MRPLIESSLFAAAFLIVGLAFDRHLGVVFTLPKLLAVRLFAVALAGVWLVRFASRDVVPVPTRVLACGAALSLWWAISTAFAIHVPTALNGVHGRYNGLWTHEIFFFVFLLIASAGFAVRDIARLTRIFVGALVPLSLYAMLQYAGWDPFVWSGDRPASAIGNPVVLAAIVGLGLPFAVVFAMTDERRASRAMWGAVLLVLSLGALSTQSRGPVIASAVVVVALLAVLARDRGRRVSQWVAGAAILATIVAAAVGYRAITLGRTNLQSSARDRRATIGAALRMTRDHPVTGVGLENFFVLYPRYRSAESEQFTPDELPTMVHSGYVQAAATTGVPGLLLYLSFLASVSWVIVKAGWRHTDARYRWLALAYVASIAGYLIQDVTGWLEVSLSMYFWTLLGLGVALGAGHARTTWPRGMRAALVAGVGFSSIAVLWLTAGTYETIRCDQLIAGAQRLNVGSEWARIEPALSGASACGSADPIYLDMAGLRYGDRFGATGDRAAYERAAMLFEQAHSSNPFNPYIAIHRISLETAARQKHVITETAPAVRDLVPALLAMDQTNGTVYESVARLRLAEGNVDEAAALVEKAGALRPARGTYRVLDGDVRRARGDRTGAIAAYRRGVDLLRAAGDKDAIAAGHKLIFMLADTGSYQAAADEAHRLIGEAPDDSLAYSLLGIVYQAMNNVPAAREAFVSALRLNPSDVTARNALRQIVERQR